MSYNRYVYKKIVDQKQEIINSLKALTEACKECKAEYRIIGSTVLVAYKNNIFRRIHDIDIILDGESSNCVFDFLKQRGFSFRKRRWAGFAWFEAEKPGYLGLTFFLVGEFTKEYFTWKFSKTGELRINEDYLKPTEYTFEGVRFIGIPITSAIAGIKQAFLNPKRSLDKKMLGEEIRNSKVRIYDNINVYVRSMKIPYLYDIFSFFYNIYGGLRVGFG